MIFIFQFVLFIFFNLSSGGVVLASKDGKIVCENTLDARLEVIFRKKLPEVSSFLFSNMYFFLIVISSSTVIMANFSNTWHWSSLELCLLCWHDLLIFVTLCCHCNKWILRIYHGSEFVYFKFDQQTGSG
jgi:ATP synthase (E/31 kDa) subunit